MCGTACDFIIANILYAEIYTESERDVDTIYIRYCALNYGAIVTETGSCRLVMSLVK